MCSSFHARSALRSRACALVFSGLLACALGFSATSARAQGVGLLAPEVDTTDDEELWFRVLAALEGELYAQGYDSELPHELDARLPANLRGCRAVSCAANVMRALRLDLAVAARYAHAVVAVELVTAEGQSYHATEAIAPSYAQRGAVRALRKALEAARRGPGPWLRVRGTPSGATVLLDGKPVGTLPETLTHVEAGKRELRVRASGYEDVRQVHAIEADADALTDVEVHLPALGEHGELGVGASRADGERLTQADPGRRDTGSAFDWNDVAGFSVLGLGALLLVKPIDALARSGTCAKRSEGVCEDVYEFGSTAALHAVAGLPLIASGIALLLARPLPVQPSAGPSHVLLHASGRF